MKQLAYWTPMHIVKNIANKKRERLTGLSCQVKRPNLASRCFQPICLSMKQFPHITFCSLGWHPWQTASISYSDYSPNLRNSGFRKGGYMSHILYIFWQILREMYFCCFETGSWCSPDIRGWLIAHKLQSASISYILSNLMTKSKLWNMHFWKLFKTCISFDCVNSVKDECSFAERGWQNFYKLAFSFWRQMFAKIIIIATQFLCCIGNLRGSCESMITTSTAFELLYTPKIPVKEEAA